MNTADTVRKSPAAKAWLAVGGVLALGLFVLIVREVPAMRREWRIIRM